MRRALQQVAVTLCLRLLRLPPLPPVLIAAMGPEQGKNEKMSWLRISHFIFIVQLSLVSPSSVSETASPELKLCAKIVNFFFCLLSCFLTTNLQRLFIFVRRRQNEDEVPSGLQQRQRRRQPRHQLPVPRTGPVAVRDPLPRRRRRSGGVLVHHQIQHGFVSPAVVVLAEERQGEAVQGSEPPRPLSARVPPAEQQQRCW